MSAPRGDGGVTAVGTDSRRIAPGTLFVCLVGERFDAHEFVAEAIAAAAGGIVVSRAPKAGEIAAAEAAGIPILCVKETLAAYQGIAACHRRRFPELPTVAITGSCGKTGTKDMVAAILRQRFGEAVLATHGNTNNLIGVPQNLLRITAKHRAAVLELGTNAPGEIAVLTALVRPTVAVLTAIAPVHLEGLGSVDGVAAEKAAIFGGLAERGGTAVLPLACCGFEAVRRALPSRTMTVGMEDGADVRVRYRGGGLGGSRFSVSENGRIPVDVEWQLSGKHQVMNSGLAVAAASALGIGADVWAPALSACRPGAMRMAITRRAGIGWINDAYNANPASMRALIDWLAEAEDLKVEALVLGLGDMLELGPTEGALHREVLAYAAERLPEAALLPVGPRMASAAAALGIAGYADLASAGQRLAALLRAGAVVALKGSRGMTMEKLMEAG